MFLQTQNWLINQLFVLIVPEKFLQYLTIFLTKMTYEEYLGLREFKEYSDTNFKPIFNETDSYHDIHLDKDNGLFYIGSYLEDERVTVKRQRGSNFR